MSKKTKSPEIIRLQQLLEELQEKPADMAEKTGVAERTINNYLWNCLPIGGQLLRALSEVYSVSIDWLLTGQGPMFTDARPAEHHPAPLIRYLDHTDLTSVQDYWWLVARSAEQSLIQAGATPGIDYNMTDLYQLAQPFVLDRFKNNGLELTAYAANP